LLPKPSIAMKMTRLRTLFSVALAIACWAAPCAAVLLGSSRRSALARFAKASRSPQDIAALHGERPPPEAVAMDSWSTLKSAMDRISSEVRQVLLVRTDVAMLQEDLSSQEELWAKSEADLESEIAALEKQAVALQTQAAAGAHIEADVAALQKALQAERGLAAEIRATFAHEESQARLEENRLATRIRQLQLRKEDANRTGALELQQARDTEMAERRRASELEREASAARDELADNETQLASEQAAAIARTRELVGLLSSLNATWEHTRSRLLDKAEVAAQLASMKITLEQETQAIIQVQTEAVQQAASCRRKTTEVHTALLHEQERAAKRRSEMVPVCNTVRSEREILQRYIHEKCKGDIGGIGGASAPPANATA